MGIFLLVLWIVVIVVFFSIKPSKKPIRSIEDESNYSLYYKRLVCKNCGGSGEIYRCSNFYETWHKSSKLSDHSSEYHEEGLCCDECLSTGQKYKIEEDDCPTCNGTGKDDYRGE
jgi:DnaJ-class molecular chaperone